MDPRPSDPATEAARRLALAVRHHRAGRLDEAEAAYRQALDLDPANADALHLVGVIAYQRGDAATAAGWIGRAVAVRGDVAGFRVNLAHALRDLGRAEEAEAHYRRAVALQDDLVEAHHGLAGVLKGAGRLDAAEAHYRRVLALRPGHAEALFNLANALRDLGRLDAAVESYRQAAAHRPGFAEALFNLANALRARGDLEGAATACAEAAAARPGFVEAHANLGNLLRDLGRLEEAAARYRHALDLRPDDAGIQASLGIALCDLGRPAEAAEWCARALARRPDLPEAHVNLGVALQDLGRLEDAAASWRRALELRPDHAQAHANLALVLRRLGRREEAAGHGARAVALQPALAEAHGHLGAALRDLGRLEDAAASLERALELRPDLADAHANLGAVLMDQGRLDEAEAACARALALRPDDAAVRSNRLFMLNFRPDLSPAAVAAEHRRAGARLASAPDVPPAYRNDRDPAEGERRLRVGYVSPDFRRHSVGFFLEPLLASHDRAAVEVFAYADVAAPDAVTLRFRELADHWRPTVGLDDDAVAEQIRRDGIDILVDLAGHTAGNRLPVFARRPAPVQATWLGYPNTTGLAAMDYRLVDAVTDPPGVADGLASETLVRLPRGFLCYRPPDTAPEPAAPPRLDAGAVTFGSFNNLSKVNAEVIAVWAEILRRVDGARLLLKSRQLADAGTRRRLADRFAGHGIAAGRLDLRATVAAETDHLALYGRMDVALDPFPYNGTTTTCEALWMGVPVVTLAGDRHAGRVGASLLAGIGLGELVAGDRAAYVATAVSLARDPARLAGVRAGLRERMRRAPLCDAAGFARAVEAAYREMWRDAGARRAK